MPPPHPALQQARIQEAERLLREHYRGLGRGVQAVPPEEPRGAAGAVAGGGATAATPGGPPPLPQRRLLLGSYPGADRPPVPPGGR